MNSPRHAHEAVSKPLWRRILGHGDKILICAGVLIILCAALMRLLADSRQTQLVEQYRREQAVATQTPEPTAAPQTAPAPPEATPPVQAAALELPGEDAQLPEPSPGKKSGRDRVELIGVLSIPKIDLTVAVGEGVDKNTLRYTAGHFPQTARPGEVGNFSLAGHRNYTFGEFFNRLDEVAPGDELNVEYGETTYTYRVTDTLVVEPHEVWVLDPTEQPTITLVTCTPIRSATHRLIVRGVLQ